MQEDTVNVLEDFLDVDLSSFNVLLIIKVPSEGGTEPGTEGGEDFVVGKRAPLDGFGKGFGFGGDQGCVGILLGDCTISPLTRNNKGNS